MGGCCSTKNTENDEYDQQYTDSDVQENGQITVQKKKVCVTFSEVETYKTLEQAQEYFETRARNDTLMDQRVNLDFSDASLEDLEGFKVLFKLKGEGANIVNLDLDFTKNILLTEKLLDEILTVLYKPSLKNLKINLRFTLANDGFCDEISHLLTNRNLSLTHFELWLMNVNDVTDEGLRSLLIALESQQSLVSLKLYLANSGVTQASESLVLDFMSKHPEIKAIKVEAIDWNALREEEEVEEEQEQSNGGQQEEMGGEQEEQQGGEYDYQQGGLQEELEAQQEEVEEEELEAKVEQQEAEEEIQDYQQAEKEIGGELVGEQEENPVNEVQEENHVYEVQGRGGTIVDSDDDVNEIQGRGGTIVDSD